MEIPGSTGKSDAGRSQLLNEHEGQQMPTRQERMRQLAHVFIDMYMASCKPGMPQPATAAA